MERFSTCELREKDVINMYDGVNLGCPCDFEFNVYDGEITALIISRPGGLFKFNRSYDIKIPWKNIERIGTDAILVRLTAEETSKLPQIKCK